MTKEEEDGFLVDLDSMKKLSIKPINELVNPLVFIRQISLVEEDNQVNDQEPDDLLQITALELMAILQKSLYQRMFTQTSILQANFKYVDNLDVKQSSYDPAILQYKYFTTSQSFNKILIQIKQVVTKYFTHIEYLPYDKKSGQIIKFKINFGPQYVVVQCSIFIVSYQQKLVCFDKVEGLDENFNLVFFLFHE